ncbi:MAG: hydantoinase B/oxoprolinase family protein [Siphonobacter sp.]
MATSYLFSVDTGGTFTDCIASDSNGRVYYRKVLSNGTLRGFIKRRIAAKVFEISTNWQLSRDILKSYTFRILEHSLSCSVKAFQPQGNIIELEEDLLATAFPIAFELNAGEEAPVLAIRIITQTALDEAFPKLILRLGTTKGTNALLEGKGARTTFVVTKGFKDLLRIGDQSRPDLFALHVRKPDPLYHEVIEVEEQIAADGSIIRPLTSTLMLSPETESVAICLKNAYRNPVHEQALSSQIEHEFVSVSTELSSHIKFLHRAETTVVNAYLAPIIHRYLDQIVHTIQGSNLFIMSSAGSLVRRNAFEPKDSLLSGPAGGVVGAVEIARRAGINRIITFDMGGTSTDVARYDEDYDYQFESRIGNARLQAPTLAIHTVAAGGGSICGFDGRKLFVGPESAGAFPGPACYGAGGPLTITDVNLLLGRLETSEFSIPVSVEAAESRLIQLLDSIETQTNQRPSAEETLKGFVQIADEIMAEAVRKISVAKGYDPADYTLVAFGGAGGLHACGIARLLQIKTILLPAEAGLLSAFGISQARIERFAERSILQNLDRADTLQTILTELEKEALAKIQETGVSNASIRKRLVFLRMKGQEASLEIPTQANVQIDQLLQAFRKRYETIYGYVPENRTIEVESIRVIAAELIQKVDGILKETERIPVMSATGIYKRAILEPGSEIVGPAVLTDSFSTTYLEEGAVATKKQDGTFLIQLSRQQGIQNTHEVIELELFTNRFRALAENMGEMLQRTSLSVNVKERLDFSCALLDAKGELIANAPHIPVHLGSLGVCVRKVREAIHMGPDDVIVTNHPGYGGSHLPDVTLITPVFENTVLLGYVASRCHHAEMGGIRPASMPPDARNLLEEGVVIPPIYLVHKGEPQWNTIRSVLTEGPYPSRSVEENIADLQAALAANREGAKGLQQLAKNYGADTLAHYMEALKAYSAQKIQERLAQIPAGIYKAKEYLDDQTPLQVTLSVQENKPLRVDFTGSGSVHSGNLNANEAIVQSVVVYTLRTLLPGTIPLNDGLLRPVQIILPRHSVLNPDFPENPAECPAVVGGNVETSQRLTDTLLKAFGVVACSQGTMNNVLFGNEAFGYYETIGGGTGAGEGFDGASGIHHHMTNTRITDPEIMEWKYPVRLERFEIREDSGGEGQYRGGDGIRRVIRFLQPVKISILTQHRIQQPYGLQGGSPGSVGKQWLIRQNNRIEPLSGISGAEVQAEDQLVIETPGGGGWGVPGN